MVEPRRFLPWPSFIVVVVPLAMAASCSSASAPQVPAEAIGTTVQAESADTFGLGEGRTGLLNVTSGGAIVNTYAPVLTEDSAHGLFVTVGPLQGAPGPFAPGDLLMIWRTAGLPDADAVPGSQAVFDLGSDVAGYEFGRVKSVSGSTITFTNPLGSMTRYAVGSQVIRVPEYTNVNIPATAGVAPYRWDGSSGGVVVFFATGTVTNAGSISADGAGFRGGQVEDATTVVPAPGCTGLTGNDEATPECGGAHKGEGLDGMAYALATLPPGTDPAETYGAGNSANGAGGGDGRNAGGGGGGHFGQGGMGGENAYGSPAGGLGGAVLSYDPSTEAFVSLGGGGGAGDEDHGTGTDGAAGGGVVLIRATAFAGAGNYSADGASVIGTAGPDGSGGGGAGGAILLFSVGAVTCTSASASGGAGGSGGSEPDGPGGGGGGGIVFIEASDASGCSPFASGGANGTTIAGANDAGAGLPYGATPGNAGQTSVGSTPYGSGMCAPALVGMNLCGGCVTDSDCPAQQVCNGATNTCGVCTATDQGSCTGTTSACNTSGATPSCVPCNGDLGSSAPFPCVAASAPDCVLTGPAAGTCGACATGADCTNASMPVCTTATLTCVACDGDHGTSAAAACPTGAPYCESSGACGLCTTDADCAGNHAGPRCDTMTGACGTACTSDAECPQSSEAGVATPSWCDDLASPSVCQAKVANGGAVPGGTCVASLAVRACASGECDDTNNECGLGDGAACSSAAVCQSGACPTSGANAGKCEACASDADCDTTAAPACSPTTNACVACTATNTRTCIGDTAVCDVVTNVCAACGGDLGSSSKLACPSSAAPLCFPSGACGKCATGADCVGHMGPVCETATGTCTSVCSTTAQCGSGQWCSAGTNPGTCEAQLANGAPLPTSPASLSVCTPAVGAEVCTAGVCNPATNTCGLPVDAGRQPDAAVTTSDGGHAAGAEAGPVGVSVEGGACAVQRARGGGQQSRGPTSLFGLALAVASLARRWKRS